MRDHVYSKNMLEQLLATELPYILYEADKVAERKTSSPYSPLEGVKPYITFYAVRRITEASLQ